MSTKTYLVPHDFSPVADCATQHALHLARQVGARVVLLHIIKKKKHSEEAQQKFDALMETLNIGPGDPQVETRIEEGNIFEDISKMAKAEKASLVIMGTHGAKGMQKVMGSFAIKVITSSNIPFMVVQKKGPVKGPQRIVLPVDLTKESLQVIHVAAGLANEFGAEVHVVSTKHTDPIKAKKIKTHLTLVYKKLKEKKIAAEVVLLEKSGAFYNNVLDYSKKVDADMIAVAYHTDSMLPQFDAYGQALITNEEEMPVLMVNSKEVGVGYF